MASHPLLGTVQLSWSLTRRWLQKGVNQKGVMQKGVAQKGVPQKGVPQKGVAQKGVSQKGVAQKGVTQKGVTQKPTILEIVTTPFTLLPLFTAHFVTFVKISPPITIFHHSSTTWNTSPDAAGGLLQQQPQTATHDERRPWRPQEPLCSLWPSPP